MSLPPLQRAERIDEGVPKAALGIGDQTDRAVASGDRPGRSSGTATALFEGAEELLSGLEVSEMADGPDRGQTHLRVRVVESLPESGPTGSVPELPQGVDRASAWPRVGVP